MKGRTATTATITHYNFSTSKCERALQIVRVRVGPVILPTCQRFYFSTDTKIRREFNGDNAASKIDLNITEV